MNEQFPDPNKSIVQEIHLDLLNKRGNRLFVKRDDLIHPDISGNKWRKLKYPLLSAKQEGKRSLLTFGGAYSNHLIATAVAAKMNGLESIGIVRGEELNSESNETLRRCVQYGMELRFVSREEYDLRNERWYHEELSVEFPRTLILKEGGAGYLGMIGCQEILKEIEVSYDLVVVAQGTSTTAAGLLMGLEDDKKLWGVPVLRGYHSLQELKDLYRWSGLEAATAEAFLDKYIALEDYHFGGYARYNDELLDLIQYFWTEHQLPLDPVYTGKAMFALLREVEKKNIRDSNILFIHTGGLQGTKSIFRQAKRDIF